MKRCGLIFIFVSILLPSVCIAATRSKMILSSGTINFIPKYGIYIGMSEEPKFEPDGATAAQLDAEISDLASVSPNFWVRSWWYNDKLDTDGWAYIKSLGVEELSVIPQCAVNVNYGSDYSSWQSAMKTFIQTAVNSAPDMPAWEIGAEPDLPMYSGSYVGNAGTLPAMTASQCVWFLSTAYSIIKAVNPNALVVGMGFDCSTGVTLLQQVVAAGGLNYVDAVSCHYYIRWGQINLSGIESAVAGLKPLWITETGWTTADQSGGQKAQNAFYQDYLNPKNGTFGADPAVRVIMAYNLNDAHYPAQPNTDDGWGLTCGPQGNYTKKLAYATFKSYFPVNAGAIIVPGDYATIQEAINHANEGDTVFVKDGTYYEHVVVNKTISLIGESKDSTILNGTTTEPIVTVEADNVKISGFSFEGRAFKNIVINTTTGVRVVENKIVFNALGIDVENSVNTTIENNIIDGFGLDNIGIMLAYSSECSIVNNTITNAVYDGIRLWFSSSNLIHRNLIKDNDYGLFFHEANLNTITENIISESGVGIYIESSSSNEIVHNNFMKNYHQAIIYDNSVNTWNNGCEGNYWSDYNGTDTSTPPDGIGDSYLPWQGVDKYPLMSPFKRGDVNHDGSVDVLDLIIVAKGLGTHPGDLKWNPHTDVNSDGEIDVLDLLMVAKYLGT